MKCPICGNKYRGTKGEHYSDICHHGAKDYIKEIERLKKEQCPHGLYCGDCSYDKELSAAKEEIERLKIENARLIKEIKRLNSKIQGW